jgi:hemerythrin-like metal-binding protein
MLRWKKIYETGISEIDDLNRKTVSVINDFYKCILSDEIEDEAPALIRKLIRISVELFAVEKQLFEIFKYDEDEMNVHLDDHDIFVKVLSSALKKVKRGDMLVIYKLADYLRNWIIEHLMIEDRKFADFKTGQKILY